ncbi:signal peptidase I [Vagococcus sp. JNUCC 83]
MRERVNLVEKKIVETIWHWLKMFVLCTIIIFIVRAFIFVPLEVTGNSMSPTLKEHDFVVVENFSTVKRFDIIVFHAPDGNTYVKRVIGLPGDRIEYKNDTLYVNEKKVEETFLKDIKKKKNEYVLTSDFDTKELLGVKTIPKDQYFVMGDNRRVSKDSRSFGTISSYSIIGKARLVYYPIKDMKIIKD